MVLLIPNSLPTCTSECVVSNPEPDDSIDGCLTIIHALFKRYMSAEKTTTLYDMCCCANPPGISLIWTHGHVPRVSIIHVDTIVFCNLTQIVHSLGLTFHF